MNIILSVCQVQFVVNKGREIFLGTSSHYSGWQRQRRIPGGIKIQHGINRVAGVDSTGSCGGVVFSAILFKIDPEGFVHQHQLERWQSHFRRSDSAATETVGEKWSKHSILA